MANAEPLRDQITDLLRRQILSGTLAPGTRLREEHIATEHGVSRVPVREAIQRLEREGYVTLSPRRSATVASVTPEQVLAVMEVRRALEVYAVRRAAQRRGGEVAADLEQVVARARRSIELRRLKPIPGLVDRFHELVAVASGNPELVALLDDLRRRVGWLFAVDVERRSPGNWADHEAILAAVLAGDEARAARLMDRHVAKDEGEYRRLAGPGCDPA